MYWAGGLQGARRETPTLSTLSWFSRELHLHSASWSWRLCRDWLAARVKHGRCEGVEARKKTGVKTGVQFELQSALSHSTAQVKPGYCLAQGGPA